MKHVKPLTQTPAKAATITIAQLITVIAQILGVLGTALTSKTATA